MSARKIAIVGAGPVGLEAALRARAEGHDVALYEAGRVGEHFARYGPVRLFTPFGMNSTELGRERLRAAGVRLPGDEETLTAAELRERYLLPLSRLPELKGAIRENARIGAIAREGLPKGQSRAREGRPFLLRIEGARMERADVVIDASGVYATPNATGPGGLLALGEESLGDRLERHLPDVLGQARARYAGKRILLVGDGRSAATVIADLDQLVRKGRDAAATRVEWVHRSRGEEALAPAPAAELERLPVLRELLDRAAGIAREAPWIRRHGGATIAAYRSLPSGAIEATLEDARGGEKRIEADRVLALVGYRPDLSLFRELQIHLCYASEGPMALAAAILAAESKDPEAAQSCLGQVPHGPETLKNPEPGFYILGAKSYGRRPMFLLTLAHRQIEDVMALIAAAEPRLHL
ncbi:MAG TPA: flavoprotein, partial [Methylomirabilota bacterium]|nr:flavoprotein [Methylomirabilota bacterium]